MENFEIGDLVYLKSGSPHMTVSSKDGEFCHVEWFDNNQQPKSNRYHSSTLTKENPDSIPPEDLN